MKVILIYDSADDVPYMESARDYFKSEDVIYQETIISPHGNLAELVCYLEKLNSSGDKAVILAIAGLSAALPGLVATNTELPVIGVPVASGPMNGVDALISMSQLPGKVPATSVGVHSKAPLNAAIAAHRIIRFGK